MESIDVAEARDRNECTAGVEVRRLTAGVYFESLLRGEGLGKSRVKSDASSCMRRREVMIVARECYRTEGRAGECYVA